jgi:hypothetical protein
MRMLFSLLATTLFIAGCTDPGREPGDDPTRNNESPGEGRPADPRHRQPGDEPHPASGADNSRGTQDVPSDEVTAPEQ